MLKTELFNPIHIKKSCFPFELNEMPNEGGRFATEFVRHLFSFSRVKNYLFKVALINQFSQNFILIYGQRAIFC